MESSLPGAHRRQPEHGCRDLYRGQRDHDEHERGHSQGSDCRAQPSAIVYVAAGTDHSFAVGDNGEAVVSASGATMSPGEQGVAVLIAKIALSWKCSFAEQPGCRRCLHPWSRPAVHRRRSGQCRNRDQQSRRRGPVAPSPRSWPAEPGSRSQLMNGPHVSAAALAGLGRRKCVCSGLPVGDRPSVGPFTPLPEIGSTPLRGWLAVADVQRAVRFS